MHKKRPPSQPSPLRKSADRARSRPLSLPLMASAEADPPIALLDLPAHLLEEVLHQLADVRSLARATASCRLLWALRDGCVSRIRALFQQFWVTPSLLPWADTLGLKPIVALAVREAYHIADRQVDRTRRKDNYIRHKKAAEGNYTHKERELCVWEHDTSLTRILREYLPAEALLAMLQRDGSYVSMYKLQDDGIGRKCDTLRLTIDPSGIGVFSATHGKSTGGYGQIDGACKLYIEGKTLRLEDASPDDTGGALWGDKFGDYLSILEDPLDTHYSLHAMPPGLKIPRGDVKTKAGDVMITCYFHGGGFFLRSVDFIMRYVRAAP